MSSQDHNKPVQEKESHRRSSFIKHWEPLQPPLQPPSQSPSQSQSQPQWSQQYLSQSSQLLPSLRSSQQQYPYPSQLSIPSSQQQSPYPSSQQQLPYPSSQQQLPYPSYSSQHLQHPSTQLLSDEEIERFAMTLPKHLHDQIKHMIHRGKRSSEERSCTSSSSTPIMTTPTLTRIDSI
ncbi:unnamed protein product [Rhizophagus irregularis]|nr:unnamed protein product [Rhizophagus irregularis]